MEHYKMGEMKIIDIEKFNKEWSEKTPIEIIQWAIEQAKNPIITTNFRPYEAAILHAVTTIVPTIPVIWCDTGYNTVFTYKNAEEIIELLNLNVHLYVPSQTVAHRNVTLGIPNLDDEKHFEFTQQVKLEPFKRAMKDHKPDVWFTNLRKGQTPYRDGIGIVSYGSDHVLKVCPFYHYTDQQLDSYLTTYQLPNEFRYFDPTKALSNRECGLHTRS